MAPFEAGSPFFGLAAPDEVTVTRQVLAEPETGLVEKTWAVLLTGRRWSRPSAAARV